MIGKMSVYLGIKPFEVIEIVKSSYFFSTQAASTTARLGVCRYIKP